MGLQVQFRYPAVQRYLHDLTQEMGEHLDTITASLTIFLDVGMLYHLFALDLSLTMI